MQVLLRRKLSTYAARDRFQPAILAGFIVVHLGALLAPWCYTQYSIPLLVVGWFLTGCLGIAIGYHRLLSHKSFDTHQWVRYALAFLGTLSVQGGPVEWVSYHRTHHKESDKPLDVHTPQAGFWWGHMNWIFFKHPALSDDALWSRAKDLANDPFFRFLDKNFAIVNLVLGVILFAVGFAVGDIKTAFSFLVWGGFLRVIFTWHIIFSVNSMCHKFGYRNFETPENSYNNPVVAIFSFGEGWHNNHHAHPCSASFTHQPYEFDVSFVVIRIMEMMGLVWNVREAKVKDAKRSTS
ncbi:MAG: acyl-CoA desaturase [Cyanophyceae cyanobacterium]